MSTLRWAHLKTAATGARFQHFFLPEDPDEAHLALVHLSRTPNILRHEGGPSEGGSYDQDRLHDLVANEGFSHHPVHGSAPSSGFMASYHAPEGSGIAAVHHISSIGPDHIAAHREAASEHLSQPAVYQGGWHDTSAGDVYLDVSKHFPSHDEDGVRNFAAQQHQKAYFHLGDFTERFMNPHQDPLAQKDHDAWKDRYSSVGTAPHPSWGEYGHKYPNTPEQDEHFRLHGVRSKNDTEYAGRPMGVFRANPDIQRRLAYYQDR